MTTIVDSNLEQRKTSKTSQMEENSETMMSKSMTKMTYKTGKYTSEQKTSTQSPQVLFEKMVEIKTAHKEVSHYKWQKKLQGLLQTNQMFEFPTLSTACSRFR